MLWHCFLHDKSIRILIKKRSEQKKEDPTNMSIWQDLETRRGDFSGYVERRRNQSIFSPAKHCLQGKLNTHLLLKAQTNKTEGREKENISIFSSFLLPIAVLYYSTVIFSNSYYPAWISQEGAKITQYRIDSMPLSKSHWLTRTV